MERHRRFSDDVDLPPAQALRLLVPNPILTHIRFPKVYVDRDLARVDTSSLCLKILVLYHSPHSAPVFLTRRRQDIHYSW